jgi:hypothetical protein
MRSPTDNTRLIWRRVSFGALVALLLLNFLLLWLTSQELPEGVVVGYWQQFGNYVAGLRGLTCVLAPLALLLGRLIGIQHLSVRRRVLDEAMWLIGLCAFVNYSAFWVAGSVEPIGTVRLDGKIFHLARFQADEDNNRYYLGQCDLSGYWCAFRKIYRTSFLQTDVPAITLSDDASKLVVMIKGEAVYTYDGMQEQCVDKDVGWCVERLR